MSAPPPPASAAPRIRVLAVAVCHHEAPDDGPTDGPPDDARILVERGRDRVRAHDHYRAIGGAASSSASAPPTPSAASGRRSSR
jgi:hypothetical protein